MRSNLWRWLVAASLMTVPVAASAQHPQHRTAAGHEGKSVAAAPKPDDASFDDGGLLAWLGADDELGGPMSWLDDGEDAELAMPMAGTHPGGGAMMHGGPGMHGPGMGAGGGMMRGGPGTHGPGMGGRGMRGRMMHRHMLAQLGLSDVQREKLTDIHERQARAGIQMRADIATAALDLRKLMRTERPDKAAIDRQIDRIAELRATRQKAHVGAMLEAHALLTPEQRKKARGLHMQDDPRPGMPRGGVDNTRDLESPKR